MNHITTLWFDHLKIAKKGGTLILHKGTTKLTKCTNIWKAMAMHETNEVAGNINS